jgi:exodeoxyribonuclease VII large subunit
MIGFKLSDCDIINIDYKKGSEPMEEQQVLSISDLSKTIKKTIEKNSALDDVWIRGEISNFTHHGSGHMYFTLKDEKSVIKAVMFKGSTYYLKFQPKNGDKVLLRGSVTVYEKGGYYQITAKEMQPDGIGSLYLAYEELKRKLQEEGLFDESVKKEIPIFPKVIGVATSPKGAAVRDILTTIKRRYPVAKIIFMPVIVQGDQAVASICNAIDVMNRYGEIDVMIVGRGGGSIEDLWAFNEEMVARAIYASKIPIISAVGHETDFTIADFVADMRAPTPTGAAEIATLKSIMEAKNDISTIEKQLKRILERKFEMYQNKLENAKRLLMYHHPEKKLQDANQYLDQTTEKLKDKMLRVLKDKENKLHHSVAKLDALSPLKTLSRGYSVAYVNGDVLKDIEQVNVGDVVEINVANGTIDCKVEAKKPKEEK